MRNSRILTIASLVAAEMGVNSEAYQATTDVLMKASASSADRLVEPAMRDLQPHVPHAHGRKEYRSGPKTPRRGGKPAGSKLARKAARGGL